MTPLKSVAVGLVAFALTTVALVSQIMLFNPALAG